jgi:hypothetical protein
LADVFISSTFGELGGFREAAERGVVAARHKCVRLEHVAMASPADEGSQRAVRESHAVVLLLGAFYGTIPPGQEYSYTELELQEAVRAGKPRFVFHVGAGYAVPKSIIDSYRGRLDDQIKRAERLRLAASRGVTPQTFTTREDLEQKVRETLELHFGAVRPADPPRRDRIHADLLPRLCDRGDQLTDFSRSFKPHVNEPINVPFLCVLHGPADQEHESCVRALVYHEFERDGLERAYEPPADAFVEWPAADALATMEKRLLYNLHLSINSRYAGRDLSVESFVGLAAASPAAHLVLRHPIRIWDDKARALLEKRYLPFWDRVAQAWTRPSSGPRPRILVFFEIAAPSAEGAVRSGARTRADRTASDMKLFDGLRGPLRARKPRSCGTVLPPLDDVRSDAFENWVARYRTWLPESVRSFDFAAEFHTGVPMRTFEARMRRLLAARESEVANGGA